MSGFAELEAEIQRLDRVLDQRVGEARVYWRHLEDVNVALEEAVQRAEACAEAAGVIAKFADSRAAEVTAKIEALVTLGLRTVFQEDLEFAIVSKTRANRPEFSFVLRSTVDGEVLETGILDARGGGVAAVAGFLLRIVVLLLKKDVRRFLLLDETFAQLSAEYEPGLADFLRELVDKTDTQIVLITHSSAYSDVADRAYEFTRPGDETKVVQVK